ncbi:MAG: hypothetical protein VKJ06_02110 [Vampirovibrionales bacterium]|nr:hypothetical protein [Vampirovibrionales bacterium]
MNTIQFSGKKIRNLSLTKARKNSGFALLKPLFITGASLCAGVSGFSLHNALDANNNLQNLRAGVALTNPNQTLLCREFINPNSLHQRTGSCTSVAPQIEFEEKRRSVTGLFAGFFGLMSTLNGIGAYQTKN